MVFDLTEYAGTWICFVETSCSSGFFGYPSIRHRSVSLRYFFDHFRLSFNESFEIGLLFGLLLDLFLFCIFQSNFDGVFENLINNFSCLFIRKQDFLLFQEYVLDLRNNLVKVLPKLVFNLFDLIDFIIFLRFMLTRIAACSQTWQSLTTALLIKIYRCREGSRTLNLAQHFLHFEG